MKIFILILYVVYIIVSLNLLNWIARIHGETNIGTTVFIVFIFILSFIGFTHGLIKWDIITFNFN